MHRFPVDQKMILFSFLSENITVSGWSCWAREGEDSQRKLLPREIEQNFRFRNALAKPSPALRWRHSHVQSSGVPAA